MPWAELRDWYAVDSAAAHLSETHGLCDESHGCELLRIDLDAHCRLAADLCGFHFAARYQLPAVYWDSRFAKEGGLMSYAYSLDEEEREGATYADRILKGEKPGDLPVQETAKFELVINLKTAKTLGITMPASLLATANEVIE